MQNIDPKANTLKVILNGETKLYPIETLNASALERILAKLHEVK